MEMLKISVAVTRPARKATNEQKTEEKVGTTSREGTGRKERERERERETGGSLNRTGAGLSNKGSNGHNNGNNGLGHTGPD